MIVTDILKGSDYALTIFTDQEVIAIKPFGKPGVTLRTSSLLASHQVSNVLTIP